MYDEQELGQKLPFELPVTERLTFFEGNDRSSATQAMAASRSLSRLTGKGLCDLYKLYCC